MLKREKAESESRKVPQLLNNKAKTQNNISLSKNRIKTEKRHNQRMAKQIQKSTVEKDRILPEKLIQDSHSMGFHYCRSWSSRNDSRTCLRKRKDKKSLLLDRQNQMGRKILVTGNGKCHLTNFSTKAQILSK